MAKYASDFPAATTLNSSDLFQVVQNGNDKKGTMTLLLNYINNNSTVFTTTSAFGTFQTAYNSHSPTHLLGSTNELDVMKTRVTNLTITTTPSAAWTSGGNSAHLGAYLYALDYRINANQTSQNTHASRHTENGADEIAGLSLDGSGYSPTQYVPVTWGIGTTDSSIGAHFAGINTEFGNLDTTIAGKAPTLNPTFTGTVTIPDLAVSDDSSKAANTKFVHDAVDALVNGATATWDTLGEIQSTVTTLLSAKASTDHNAAHETGGADVLTGTKTYAGDFTPSYYTPAVYRSGGTTTEVGSHLKGIDDKILLLESPSFIQVYGASSIGTFGFVSVYEPLYFSSTELSIDCGNSGTYITVGTTGYYSIRYNATVTPTTNTDNISMAIRINGTDHAASASNILGLQQNVSGELMVLLTANTYEVSLGIKNDSGTDGITINNASLTLQRF